MVQKSLNCQKSALFNKNMSFWPLKTLFSLKEPIWRLLSLKPPWKNASFDIWHIHRSENFYYCRSRMVWITSIITTFVTSHLTRNTSFEFSYYCSTSGSNQNYKLLTSFPFPYDCYCIQKYLLFTKFIIIIIPQFVRRRVNLDMKQIIFTRFRSQHTFLIGWQFGLG